MYATGTEGLDFQLINGGDNDGTYRVRKGTVTTGEVHIPAYHRPNTDSPYLPITEIGSTSDFNFTSGAFYLATNTITAVHIPSTVTTIGNNAFAVCTGLTGVTIPESVTYIGNDAFTTCFNLTSIEIPESVTYIGSDAFSNCTSLTSVAIPGSVTSIGPRAFRRCTSLTSITINEYNLNYSSEGGILYNKAKTEIMDYPTASGDVTIPENITSIGPSAFYDCANITSIEIHAGVTSIGTNAFCSCTGIISITIPAGITNFGGYAFLSWTASQTINIAGYASGAAADAAWGTNWRQNTNAVIKYLQSDGTYQ
jgi:hypothetical protein